jgi:hypothetical protein
MSNANGKSPDNPSGKNEFADLVTTGLGYCCINFFFTHIQATISIADRLGVTSRTVRIHKARWREGLYPCRDCSNCMAKRQKKSPE